MPQNGYNLHVAIKVHFREWKYQSFDWKYPKHLSLRVLYIVTQFWQAIIWTNIDQYLCHDIAVLTFFSSTKKDFNFSAFIFIFHQNCSGRKIVKWTYIAYIMTNPVARVQCGPVALYGPMGTLLLMYILISVVLWCFMWMKWLIHILHSLFIQVTSVSKWRQWVQIWSFYWTICPILIVGEWK